MMSVVAPDAALELRETNARLRLCLDNLNPEYPSINARLATPQQMASLLSELMRAGERLLTLPTPAVLAQEDPLLERELGEYRRNVERLRTLLPSIHSTLLAERARLEQERARVESAAEWVRRSRQTL